MAGLSRRAYARHRGCAESAVRQALAAGRIQLEADGLIDPVKADDAWARNTWHSKLTEHLEWLPGMEPALASPAIADPPETPLPIEVRTSSVPTLVSRAAVASVKETLEGAGEEVGDMGLEDSDGLDGAGVTLTNARKAKTIQETYLTALRVRHLRGELVDRKAAEDVVFTRSRMERDRLMSWPASVAPQLAATLKVDAREVLCALEEAVYDLLVEFAEEAPFSLAELATRKAPT